jgi:hypothetical protein
MLKPPVSTVIATVLLHVCFSSYSTILPVHQVLWIQAILASIGNTSAHTGRTHMSHIHPATLTGPLQANFTA